MPEKRSTKDYSKYNFESFLQDDYFIQSVKKPTEESLCFWQKLIDNGLVDINEFTAAKDFLETINDRKDVISENEISDLWNKIDHSNSGNRRKKHSRKRLYTTIGIAASIAILFLAIPYLLTEKNSLHVDEITSFAKSNKLSNDNSQDIQLIISETNTIVLGDADNSIVYDSTEIKISEKEISKREAATFNQLVVPKGKRSRLILSDGTKMQVNSGTRVVYPVEFNKDQREIYVDGEIFIEVTKDEKRPFIVKTDKIDIQVLGTKFNVMAYETDNSKQVVLTEGSVKVSSKHNSGNALLVPSQMYDLTNGQSTIKKVDTSRYTSWTKGLLFFESEKLEVLLLKLSRYYGTDIHFEDNIANMRCSGKLDMKETLDDVLKGLTNTLPIQVQYTDGKYNVKKNTM